MKKATKRVWTEAKKRLDYLIGQGLDRRAWEWFEQGSPCCCTQIEKDTVYSIRCDRDERMQKAVEQAESRYGVNVYYVVVTNTPHLGALLSLFYISGSKSDWETEWRELEKGIPTVAACLFDEGQSRQDWEFGSIRIQIVDGGIIRTQ